jgi:two-component system response regulator (stage 0 sporulation protein A)
MDKMALRVAILDDDIILAETVADFLCNSGRYEIVGIARDGEQGLALIRENAVDVAVIDLLMPGKDGFFVLEELDRNPENKPVCIVLSGISRESVTRMAFDKGADYYILKPFDLNMLDRRINEVYEKKYVNRIAPPRKPLKDRPEDYVLRFLHGIPIPNTLNGYDFLKQAIIMAIEDDSLLEGITKRLYPVIGKKNKSTGQRVERAIRHAIEMAWERGGGKNYARLMGYGASEPPRPTNGAFISAVVERYHSAYALSAGAGSTGVTNTVL